jgi:hypothetical protein
MKSVRDLVRELYYWMHIGTADDIVKCQDQRPEYKHLVVLYKNADIAAQDIPRLVFNALVLEMRRPKIFQPTFWRLLWLGLKKRL